MPCDGEGVEALRHGEHTRSTVGRRPKQRGEPIESPTFPQPIRATGRPAVGRRFITFGVGAACMHSYTVFLIAFIEAFGWSRAESSIAYSVSQMITGATSPLVGVLVDRLGPKRLVLIGGVLLAIGLSPARGATRSGR